MPTKEVTRKSSSTNCHGVKKSTQSIGYGSSRERRIKREEAKKDVTNRTSAKSSGSMFTPEKKISKEHSSPRSISAFPSGIVRAKRLTESTAVRRVSSSDALFSQPRSECTSISDRVVCYANKGCEEFRRGEHEAAMKCFQEAFCLLHAQNTSSSDDDGPDVARNTQKEISCKDKSNYIYQRLEFDEGMRAFSEPIKVDRNSSMNMEAVLLYNKGQVYMHNQSWEKARLCFVSAMETRTSNNLSFLYIASLQCIGQIQYYLGKYQDAMVSYKNSIRHAKDLYGKTHLTIAAALNSLSVICYHMLSLSQPLNSNTDYAETSSTDTKYLNLLQKAKDYSKRSLSIRMKLLEKNHPDIATTLNNSGRLYVMQGEFQKALECYKKALEIRAERLGKDSLDYAATAFNTGQSYHHIRNFPKAMHYYQEFLSVAQRKFSKNHRDVAVVLSGMAEIHQELDEMDQALELYQESLEVGRNALGDDHPEIAMILNRLGNFHFSNQNYDDAFDAYSKGLEIERRASDDANCIVSLCNLGEIYRQRKEWDAALSTFKDAMKIQKKYVGDKNECVKLANTLHVIGITYDKKGDSDSGLRYLQEALIMKRNVLGETHIDVTPTLTSIGIILFRENKLSLALNLLQESLHIRRTKLGANNRDVAFTLYNIALVQLKMDSLTEAINCLTEVLRIEKYVLGEDHKDVAITLFKLGETFQKYNELDSALRCFNEALDIERKVMLKNDPLTIARTLQEIGNIHLYLGNANEMMKAFIEAARIYQESSMDLNAVVVSKHLYAIGLSYPKAAAAA